MNKPDIEETLKSAYIDSGGSEREFDVDRNSLLNQYRQRSVVDAALEATRRNRPTVSDLLRQQRDAEQTPTADVLARFAAGQKKDVSE